MRMALALLATVVLASGARAADELVFSARAGDVLHGSLPLEGTAVDATTGNATGIRYLTAPAPQGAGRWITVGKPQDGRTPFTIRVPRGTPAGQYFAGIAGKGGIVRIEVDVAGPLVARFVLGAVNVGSVHSRQRLYLHVSNTGNVARRPQGAVSIQRRGGSTLRSVRFRMASFLPHTSIDYPLPLGRRLLPGSYVAVVRLTYPDANGLGSQTSSAAPQFTVSKQARAFRPHPTSAAPTTTAAAHGSSTWPWVAAAAAGGALLLGAAGYGALALRRRRPVTVTVTPVQAPAHAVTAPCNGPHYWQVDWDSAQPGQGGAVTYVHRCRRCGLEVRATDIADAAVKARA